MLRPAFHTHTMVRRIGVILTTLLATACLDKAPIAPTGLQAIPENSAVTLSWNPMPDADAYRVYYALESGVSPENYRTLKGAGVMPSHRAGARVEGLENDETYYFRVAGVSGDQEGPSGPEISATPEQPVDRTFLSPVSVLGKVADNGNPLPLEAIQWDCVSDSKTGLLWEVKTRDGALRDRRWTYTFYDSQLRDENGQPVGSANGGMCIDGRSCDTEHFINAVNQSALCGSNQWRLPTKAELRTIGQDGADNRAVPIDWFPNSRAIRYWVSAPHTNYSNRAWQLYFSYAHDSYYGKGYNYAVRLVSAP